MRPFHVSSALMFLSVIVGMLLLIQTLRSLEADVSEAVQARVERLP